MNGVTQTRKSSASVLLYAAAFTNCVSLILLNLVNFQFSKTEGFVFAFNTLDASAFLNIAVGLCLSIALVLCSKRESRGILAVIIGCVSISELLTVIQTIGLYVDFSLIPDIIVIFRLLLNALVFPFGAVTVVGLLKNSASTSILVVFAALSLFSILLNDIIAGSISSMILIKRVENIYSVIRWLIYAIASILVGISILMIGLQRAENKNT